MLAGIGLIAMNTKILMDNSLANNGQQIGDSKLLIEKKWNVATMHFIRNIKTYRLFHVKMILNYLHSNNRINNTKKQSLNKKFMQFSN